MPPLAAAVVAIASTVASVGSVVVSTIGTAFSALGAGIAGRALLTAGINLAMNALTPKPKPAFRGDNQQVSNDPATPRQAILGEFVTAGSLVTWQAWGANNEYIILLLALADHKCHSLTGVWWDNGWATINLDGSIEESKNGGKYHLWVTFHDGDWNQAADADLIANSSGRWTANERGRGVCYVTVKARFNKKIHEQGLNGLFSMLFKVKGLYCYDRRLDTTAGGSGSHRANDQTTWAWSDNAALITENVLRGIRVENTSQAVGSRDTDLWFGPGLSSGQLPHAENVAAMNGCDEAVSLKAGGTEARYRVGGIAYGDTSPRDVLENCLTAQAGRLVITPGRWIIRTGISLISVRSFVDNDFRIDGESRFRDHTPLGEIVNCVTGRFADPTQQYKPVPLPPRVVAAYETADGGRKSEDWDLAYVTSNTQGQRVLKISGERHGRPKTARRTLAPENLDLEPMDRISWTSARYNWSADFEIEKAWPGLTEDDFLKVTVDLRETDSAIYSWNPATDELSTSATTPIPTGSIGADPVTGLDVTTTIVLSTGEARPGLLMRWDAVADPTAVGVRVEYRIVSTTDAYTVDYAVDPTLTATTQQLPVFDSVIGSAAYEARAAILYDPWQEPVFSDWQPASGTTDPTNAVPGPDTVTTTTVATGAVADIASDQSLGISVTVPSRGTPSGHTVVKSMTFVVDDTTTKYTIIVSFQYNPVNSNITYVWFKWGQAVPAWAASGSADMTNADALKYVSAFSGPATWVFSVTGLPVGTNTLEIHVGDTGSGSHNNKCEDPFFSVKADKRAG